jgi:hypothetical protein
LWLGGPVDEALCHSLLRRPALVVLLPAVPCGSFTLVSRHPDL